MATIELYADKINQMSGLIKEMKKSVADYKSELSALKKKALKINRSICNVDDVVSSIQASSQMQEQKITSLETFRQNSEQFIEDAARIDSDVADVINQRKEDFYEEFYYLKPECEKNGWEKFCDGVKAVGEWCKEHWESICNIVLAIIAVVAIVALCVVTFGGAVVFLAAAVGAIVGLAGQLVSDIISWAITGEWTGTWQSYAGALLGGIVGGVLTLTGNFAVACAADAAISTLFGESLEGITGGEKRTMTEIWLDTALSAGTAVVFSKIFGNISEKISKNLSKNIPVLRRLAGRGSYDASFKMVITKLKTGIIKNFTIKSVRNGVIGGLAGNMAENIAGGFNFDNFVINGIKEIFSENRQNVNTEVITISQIVSIKQINFLPIKSWAWR